MLRGAVGSLIPTGSFLTVNHLFTNDKLLTKNIPKAPHKEHHSEHIYSMFHYQPNRRAPWLLIHLAPSSRYYQCSIPWHCINLSQNYHWQLYWQCTIYLQQRWLLLMIHHTWYRIISPQCYRLVHYSASVHNYHGKRQPSQLFRPGHLQSHVSWSTTRHHQSINNRTFHYNHRAQSPLRLQYH